LVCIMAMDLWAVLSYSLFSSLEPLCNYDLFDTAGD